MAKQEITFIYENPKIREYWSETLNTKCQLSCYKHPYTFLNELSLSPHPHLIITGRYFTKPSVDLCRLAEEANLALFVKAPWLLCWPGPQVYKKYPFFSGQIRSSLEVSWELIKKAIYRIKQKNNSSTYSLLREVKFNLDTALLYIASKAQSIKDKRKIIDLANGPVLEKRQFIMSFCDSLENQHFSKKNLNLFHDISSSPYVLVRIFRKTLVREKIVL